jgi:HK97 gp10 family phage protein
MSEAKVTIKGLAEFRVQMAQLPNKMQRGALRAMMRDAMKLVRDDARANAPKLTTPVLKNGVPTRLPGTLRNAISVRASKAEDKAGNVGVFVNVRPLKGNTYRRAGSYVTPDGQKKNRYLLTKKSQRGAENPRDPYFWRWIEFGTKARKTKSGKALGAVRPYKFLQGAADKLQAAADKLSVNLQAWVAKANNTGRIE